MSRIAGESPVSRNMGFGSLPEFIFILKIFEGEENMALEYDNFEKARNMNQMPPSFGI
jgi:hypothetical protein